MKITSADTFLVDPTSPHAGVVGHKHLLFVRLRTDSGLKGWGESCTQLDRDIVQHIQDLTPRRSRFQNDPVHVGIKTQEIS
jgi:L-alanine-DL-glutamate epimerase-like enolase superfamily enzyme